MHGIHHHPTRAGPRRARAGLRPRRLRWLVLVVGAAALLYAVAVAAAGSPAANAAANAAAGPQPLPPLVDPATAQHLAGKVIWLDLVTPRLDSAERFYAGLFGWSFRTTQVGGRQYATAWLDAQPVAGLIQRAAPPGARRRPVWLAFLSVSDVEAAKRLALRHGARLLADTRDYPQRGRQAILADPEGAVFAVLDSSAGDPPDDLPDTGDWIWSALLTRDPDREAAFYQAVFGYQVFDVAGGSGDGSDHIILSSDNYARESVNQLSGQRRARRRPHWLNFVRVADVDAAADRAAALGGQVLLAPHADREGNRMAVIADPAGAALGLMQWTGVAGNSGAAR
jgi:predicted enzyme related to lactoylglutathione lyase